MIDSHDIKVIIYATALWSVIAVSFYYYHKPYKKERCAIHLISLARNTQAIEIPCEEGK